MTNKELKEMVDNVEEYVLLANVDEVTGYLFRLAIRIEKDNDVEAMVETALIVAFSEELK